MASACANRIRFARRIRYLTTSPAGSNINNEMIRQIAYDYNLPLWDFDAVASTIPGKGLDQDGTHMTAFFAHDWSSPIAFQRGYGLMNLSALIALDKVWRTVVPPS